MRRQLTGGPTGRSFKDLKSLDTDSSLEEAIETLNALNFYFSQLSKYLSFQNNFDGYIASVEIAAGASADVQHFLGITPKFRVILRQEGNGVLTDIPSGWNDKVIALKNNGAETVRAVMLIARE
jgi:hypothetical protein